MKVLGAWAMFAGHVGERTGVRLRRQGGHPAETRAQARDELTCLTCNEVIE